jgi:hypothetical protein
MFCRLQGNNGLEYFHPTIFYQFYLFGKCFVHALTKNMLLIFYGIDHILKPHE